ncbi:type IV secretory system conjugative DNA transfer family protein [Candidatus Kaiserbacteria bacterium]|nr:type IV secretory system conjugative DNA transfer family protein [Candidatus Kaiserbacteria bacterium]
MPPRSVSTAERPRVAISAPVEAPKFKSPEEELAYLREQVKQKENELGAENKLESDRIARREVAAYAATPAHTVLHQDYKLPEHETLRKVLKLDPEEHDTQMDEMLKIIQEHGIRNALSVAAKMKNPHLEDDLHRMLVRYIAEGLPDKGMKPPEKIRHGLATVLFEIHPQAYGEGKQEERQQNKLEQLLSSSEQLYNGLTSLVEYGEGFSLEIAVPEGTEAATLYLGVPRVKQMLAERLISSVFPNARIVECRGDYNIFNFQGEHAAAHAILEEHPAYPLKTPEMFEHDPMNVLLAAFAKIAKHGEGAALQIVISTEGDKYNGHYKHVLLELQRGRVVEQALRVAETTLGREIQKLRRDLLHPVAEKDREFQLRIGANKVAQEVIERKVKSRIAPALIRLVASAPTKARADELLSNLKAPFTQYDDPKGNRMRFENVGWWNLSGFLRDFTYRTFDASLALPLSLSEVTSIFHFTAEKVTTSRELKRSFAKQTPAPVEMPSEGITLGVNRYGAQETPVRFAPGDRLRHCYVIGQTGTGKTTILKNMIAQDIKNGEGVAFIDPHGNDIEDILASVPPERMNDVIYFDPAYTPLPMGLNMLEYDRNRPEMKTFVVDEVYGIFRKLYADVPEAFGPMFEQYYRNSVQLVVEDPESGSTFLEVPRVLSDRAFREKKLAACNNPVIAQFWRKIAEAAGGDASLENVVPYITSKFDVFLANDIMRPIVAQQKSAFDFRRIMDDKKIFLANLSKGRLGDRNTSLLGLVLVSKFLQAAFSRVDARSDYPVFYLYIDEFQNFATPSIGTILSEARKYKLSLNIAHQFIAQLDEKIRDAVIGNVGTKASFRVGTTDAEFLAKQFVPTFSQQDLENLPNFNAVMALLVNGIPARPFTIETERPPARDYSRIDVMKELSYKTYGRPREDVEKEIQDRYKEKEPAPGSPEQNPFNSYL